jgi:pimeloyl-ACP methyl ester carboxylesterase
MTTQFIISKDGTRIAYDVTGKGPALVLLHGAGKTRRDWHKVGYVERLRDEFTVISIDLRGSGDSDYLADIADYAIEKICADIFAVADACDVQQFFVWGFSLGGNIARYLGAWSDRVIAMAVVGVPFGPAVDEEFDRYIDEFVEKWGPLAKAYNEGKLTEKKRQSAIKGRIPVWVACFQAMRDWPRVDPGDMGCPTMLVVGTKNKSVMKWAEANREALDKAAIHTEIIEGLGHQQEFSKIDQVFPIVRSFFKDN